MPLTNRISDVSSYFHQLFQDNQVQLGLLDVFYGDQTLIPRSPALCVETGETVQTLVGIPRRVDIDMELYLLVYLGEIQSIQVNRLESEVLADNITDFIHAQDSTLAGLAIHTYVTKSEFGYARKTATTVFRVVRLTVSIKSKVNL